ncbi:MAG TPA: protein translocase subunit SecD, partial [Rhodocyclaceae bacterium]|nr:protein translocase subunit SecD [Rhodocyclaceae bacterium]
MNRYPLWKNILIGLVLLFGLIYTIPNFYGEVPAVQISSGKATLKLDQSIIAPVERALREAGIGHTGIIADENSIRFRFEGTDEQMLARDLIHGLLNPDPADPSYIVALNLLPATPGWLTQINALPMYLGLDLRGGVHFLLEVDMAGAITNRLDSTAADLRTLMRDRRVRHAGISREGNTIELRFRDTEQREAARRAIQASTAELVLADRDDGPNDLKLVATLDPAAQQTIREFAITQNITTLRNRINELGVAEPVIQQQGADRIVVQLPGVQDVAQAKDILGRTATLEVRMVDDTPGALESALAGQVPFGTELYTERGGAPLLVR